jgi:hypothetical protein
VRVKLRIRHATDWPRGGVDELRPHQVAGCPLFVAAVLAHAGFDFGLDVAHGFIDRRAEGIEDVSIAGEAIDQRHRLGHRPGEVVADRALRARAGCQALACPWVEVVAQPVKRQLVYRSLQAKQQRPLPAPGAYQLLAFAVVVCRRVIALGGVRAILLRDPQHVRIISTKSPD